MILVTAGVFALEVWFGEAAFLLKYSLIPVRLVHGAVLPHAIGESDWPAWITLVTSVFLHGSLGHLVGNLWFLWLFGDNVEDSLGHVGYFLFYLAAGAVAGLCHVALNSTSSTPTLGASGAVSAVLGAYLVLYPKIRIRTLLVFGFFIEVVHIPATVFLGLWFLFQFLGGIFSGLSSGIAFGAHVGGFVAGVIAALLFCRKPSEPPRFTYEPRRLRRW